MVQGLLGHSQDDCEYLPFFGIPDSRCRRDRKSIAYAGPAFSQALRVAYLSADSRSHPVAYLTAELFGNYRTGKRMGELANASSVRLNSLSAMARLQWASA